MNIQKSKQYSYSAKTKPLERSTRPLSVNTIESSMYLVEIFDYNNIVETFKHISNSSIKYARKINRIILYRLKSNTVHAMELYNYFPNLFLESTVFRLRRFIGIRITDIAGERYYIILLLIIII